MSKSPGWIFWLFFLAILVGCLGASTRIVAEAIQRQNDLYLCLEVTKVLKDMPVVCDAVFGTDSLEGSAA